MLMETYIVDNGKMIKRGISNANTMLNNLKQPIKESVLDSYLVEDT